jgi:hypothetical protein
MCQRGIEHPAYDHDLTLFGNRVYFDQYTTMSDASTVYQKNFLKNLKHAEQVGKYRNYFDFHPACSKKFTHSCWINV